MTLGITNGPLQHRLQRHIRRALLPADRIRAAEELARYPDQ